MKPTTIEEFNASQNDCESPICEKLMHEINRGLPMAESKIWHGHPVWFLDGNPIVGYNKLKGSIRLMFWSGADFEEPDLKPGTGKFKDASVCYTGVEQLNIKDLKRWLKKSTEIQWDYKNICKRKGKLVRLI
ncbi:hypothetical protein Misp06_00936 [Microbulbifer sp. NBRC 101763]|uniref:DUF1801 domain-containing protein n=1 Tax=Microbulbifer sp. NBRC 101763 TaxID=1113820 RepID=UPI0030AF0F16